VHGIITERRKKRYHQLLLPNKASSG